MQPSGVSRSVGLLFFLFLIYFIYIFSDQQRRLVYIVYLELSACRKCVETYVLSVMIANFLLFLTEASVGFRGCSPSAKKGVLYL